MNEAVNQSRKINWHTGFFISILLLLFLKYPVSLIHPFGSPGGDLPHEFELPVLAISATLSLSYILWNFNTSYLNKSLLYLALGFNGLIALSAYINHSSFIDCLHISSYINTPLALYINRQKTNKSESLLFVACALLFTLNLIIVLSLNNIVGIHGNQNWLTAVITPCAFILLKKIKLHNKALSYLVKICLLSGLVFALYKTSTRTLIPATAILLSLYLIVKFKKKAIPYMAVALIGITILGFTKKDSINRLILADIRTPLFTDSLAMVLEKPLLGHGPGQFIPDFPEYASEDLKNRLHSAPIFEHPHNEALHMGSQLGLIALIIWLLFLTQAYTKSPSKELINTYSISFLLIFILGQADKSLNQGTSALLLLILWSFTKPPEPTASHNKTNITGQALKAFAIMLILMSLMPIYNYSSSRYFFWQGRSIINTKQSEAAKYFIKASDNDPQNLHANYHTARLLLHLKKPQEAIEFLDRIIVQAPQYSKTAEVHGNALESLSQRQNKEPYKKHLHSLAIKSFQTSIDQHPQDLKRYLPFINSLDLRLDKQLESVLNQLRTNLLKKLSFRDSFRSQTYQSMITEMIESVKNDNSQGFLNLANRLHSDLKFPNQAFHHLLSDFDTIRAQTLVNSARQNFNKSDFLYYKDIITFKEATKNLSLHDLLQSINIDPSLNTFLLPGKAISQSKLSVTSSTALISSYLRLKQFNPIIHNTTIYWKDEPHTKKIDLSKSLLVETVKTLPEIDHATYFYYPQETLSKNYLLSIILNIEAPPPLITKTSWPLSALRNSFFVLKNEKN